MKLFDHYPNLMAGQMTISRNYIAGKRTKGYLVEGYTANKDLDTTHRGTNDKKGNISLAVSV